MKIIARYRFFVFFRMYFLRFYIEIQPIGMPLDFHMESIRQIDSYGMVKPENEQ